VLGRRAGFLVHIAQRALGFSRDMDCQCHEIGANEVSDCWSNMLYGGRSVELCRGASKGDFPRSPGNLMQKRCAMCAVFGEISAEFRFARRFFIRIIDTGAMEVAG